MNTHPIIPLSEIMTFGEEKKLEIKKKVPLKENCT